MKQFATITVIGRDKTGVIARVTEFSVRAARQHRGARGTGHARPVQHDAAGVVAEKEFRSAALRAGLEGLAAQLGMEIKVRFTDPGRRQRFAIFVTKEPRCFEALAKAVAKKSIVADPAVVIGNHASFEPLAKKFRLPFVCVPWEDRAKAEVKALKIAWRNTRLISSCWRGS